MPDWSYRPLMKPWMMRAPIFAHALVLRTLATIGKTAGLYKVVDLLGHMAPAEAIRRSFAGMTLASPVGLAAPIDGGGRAALAFERFGVGFLEHGPVGSGAAAAQRMERGNIVGARPGVAVDEYLHRSRPSRMGVPRFVRLQDEHIGDARRTMQALEPHATAFILPPSLQSLAAETRKPCGLAVRVGASPPDIVGLAFLVLDPSTDVWSQREREDALRAVVALRAHAPAMPIIHAAGGVSSPADARDALAAGATAVALSHGFVDTGPGLPKRINEVLAPAPAPIPAPQQPLVELAREGWLWALALGLAMIFGGILATIFSLTSVILPYDVAATGLDGAAITAFNERLLHFMAHDRLTLAGTMVSLGALYVGLAWGGMRRGLLFAKEAIALSTLVGFISFLAFVGYGYFDQFHAFVAAVLFPVAIQVVVGRDRPRRPPAVPDLHNDGAWRLAAVGQLTYVVQGVGLLAAGLAITLLGTTSVFVATDLAFLGTDAASIHAHHANLVPLVAHDRATFGGMLLATGCGVLVTALWGFQRGASWLWWTLALAGFPAYVATLWIHADIGYVDALHLSPVVIGLVLQLIGVATTRPYLRG